MVSTITETFVYGNLRSNFELNADIGGYIETDVFVPSVKKTIKDGYFNCKEYSRWETEGVALSYWYEHYISMYGYFQKSNGSILYERNEGG